MTNIDIRSERATDIATIRHITKPAFAPMQYSSQTEAEIIDALRDAGALTEHSVAKENRIADGILKPNGRVVWRERGEPLSSSRAAQIPPAIALFIMPSGRRGIRVARGTEHRRGKKQRRKAKSR